MLDFVKSIVTKGNVFLTIAVVAAVLLGVTSVSIAAAIVVGAVAGQVLAKII